MKILFVGSNPSEASTTCEAFSEDTKSGRILRSWIKDIEGECLFDNIARCKTTSNRPLTREETARGKKELQERIAAIAPDRIIALGKTAAAVLKQLNLHFLEMPHPSGLNRLLNDKTYVDEKLAMLRSFCRESDNPHM